MKLHHAAMYVNDIEAQRAMFERYFGAASSPKYHNPKTGFSSYFLSFDGGAQLELMHTDALAADVKNRLGYAHIALSVGSTEEVDRLTQRLRADGFEIVGAPRTTGDGYYESCVLDCEGNRIELTV